MTPDRPNRAADLLVDCLAAEGCEYVFSVPGEETMDILDALSRHEGVHHVTLITGDAPRNVDFYAGTLGLRLVKKTVNQDDTSAYHLFFADGAGTFQVLAALPLADGYSLNFRNFDVQAQKPQIKQLKVVGSESVTVPTGTFDAYKLEIITADNDSDKQTVWIDKASRKVLKISAVFNGAVLTSELTP